jgi:transcriptional regulator with XRE-family HTH domain
MAGRPRYKPTDEQRADVRHRAALGTNQDALARRLGISINTLLKYFRDELTRGIDDANLQVAQSIFNAATGRLVIDGPLDADGKPTFITKRVEPNATLAIWWSKTRMGWKEPARDLDEMPPAMQANTTIIIKGGLPPVPYGAGDEVEDAKTNGATAPKPANGASH